MFTIAARGDPSAWNNIESISSGTPWLHAANAGEAANPLSFIASLVRSLSGNKVSSCITPSLRNGGAITFSMSDSMLKAASRLQ